MRERQNYFCWEYPPFHAHMWALLKRVKDSSFPLNSAEHVLKNDSGTRVFGIEVYDLIPGVSKHVLEGEGGFD